MQLMLAVTVVLASAGALLGAMMLTYATVPSMRRHPEPEAHLNGPKFWTRVVVAGIFSTFLTYALTFILADQLITTRETPWWRGVLEALAILFVYDIFYYVMHRFGFHKWNPLMEVHAVHHQSHRPIPIHAMHLHPIENLFGIGLFIFTVWLLGPVNLWAFTLCFFIHAWLNIITHAGLDLPIPYLRFLSRIHDQHHKNMVSGNYGTLSPIPDMLFGTVERDEPVTVTEPT
jgi:sterol desaturase/sphingolipid hydroxylase (fatty acid hydroxylase superfamily)